MKIYIPLIASLLALLCACPPEPPPEPPPCQLGAPQVAGTAATDALANAPGRCGIAPYRWLRSSRLGEVLATGADLCQRSAPQTCSATP